MSKRSFKGVKRAELLTELRQEYLVHFKIQGNVIRIYLQNACKGHFLLVLWCEVSFVRLQTSGYVEIIVSKKLTASHVLLFAWLLFASLPFIPLLLLYSARHVWLLSICLFPLSESIFFSRIRHFDLRQLFIPGGVWVGGMAEGGVGTCPQVFVVDSHAKYVSASSGRKPRWDRASRKFVLLLMVLVMSGLVVEGYLIYNLNKKTEVRLLTTY